MFLAAATRNRAASERRFLKIAGAESSRALTVCVPLDSASKFPSRSSTLIASPGGPLVRGAASSSSRACPSLSGSPSSSLARLLCMSARLARIRCPATTLGAESTSMVWTVWNCSTAARRIARAKTAESRTTATSAARSQFGVTLSQSRTRPGSCTSANSAFALELRPGGEFDGGMMVVDIRGFHALRAFGTNESGGWGIAGGNDRTIAPQISTPAVPQPRTASAGAPRGWLGDAQWKANSPALCPSHPVACGWRVASAGPP